MNNQDIAKKSHRRRLTADVKMSAVLPTVRLSVSWSRWRKINKEVIENWIKFKELSLTQVNTVIFGTEIYRNRIIRRKWLHLVCQHLHKKKKIWKLKLLNRKLVPTRSLYPYFRCAFVPIIPVIVATEWSLHGSSLVSWTLLDDTSRWCYHCSKSSTRYSLHHARFGCMVNLPHYSAEIQPLSIVLGMMLVSGSLPNSRQ